MATTKKFVGKNGFQSQNVELVSNDGSKAVLISIANDGTISFTGANGNLLSLKDIAGGVVKIASDIGNVVIGDGVDNGTDKVQIIGDIIANRLKSSVATGVSPLLVSSTTVVANLNSDMLDGQHGSYYLAWANLTSKPTTISGYGITDALTLGSTVGSANGTASAGVATTAARSDHVHPSQTSVSGNAGTATTLQTTRTLTIGSTGKTFNGSANVSWTLAEIGAVAANTAITPATATKVTYDAKGLVTGSSSLDASDIPSLDWSKITTGKPTTLSGYGITDALTLGSTAGVASGTASAGVATTAARSDHVHPSQTSVSGNAGTATALQTARTFTIGNTGKSFNGGGNVSWTLAEIGAAPSIHSHSFEDLFDSVSDIQLSDTFVEKMVALNFFASVYGQ